MVMNDLYEKRGYLLEDFRLFHLRDSLGTHVDYHYHDFYKIVMLHSGSGSYTVDGRRYLLRTGDIILVGNLRVHKPEFPSGQFNDRTVIYISPEFMQQHSRQDGELDSCFSGASGHVLRLGIDAKNNLFRLAEQLENELQGNCFGREMISRSLLLQIIIECNRVILTTDFNALTTVQTHDSKILEILQYLDENSSEDINIDDLAHKFYISKYYMMRRFHEETGTSIHNYLSNRRLLQARSLIQKGTSTTEACYISGFKSYSAFSRAYFKFFAVTPTGRSGSSLPLDATQE